MHSLRSALVAFGALVVLTVTMAACIPGSGGGDVTINGLVTRSDTNARTFTVQTTDGRTLDFRMVSNSKGNIMEIKEHQDLRKPIEVRYKPGGNPPYDVSFAD
jgi:hypothetical protein